MAEKYKPDWPSSPQDKSANNSQGNGDGKRKFSKFLLVLFLHYVLCHLVTSIQFEFFFPIYITRQFFLVFLVENEILHDQIIHLGSHEASKGVFR